MEIEEREKGVKLLVGLGFHTPLNSEFMDCPSSTIDSTRVRAVWYPRNSGRESDRKPYGWWVYFFKNGADTAEHQMRGGTAKDLEECLKDLGFTSSMSSSMSKTASNACDCPWIDVYRDGCQKGHM